MKNEFRNKLEKIALDRSTPFCYFCYQKAPSNICPICGSDDLMRQLEGVGVEWGTDWIIKHILQEELTSVDTEESFEESVRQCYPEKVAVGWMNLDVVSVMKDQDPISWRCAQSDWESQEEEEGNIMSFNNGSTFYWTYDLEKLIEQN